MPLYHRGNGLPAYVRTCPPLLTATWYRRSDYDNLASHEKLEESHYLSAHSTRAVLV